MVVFNAYAILVGLILAVLLAPLYFLAPDFMHGSWGKVVIGAAMVVVGAVTDLFGIKGRLFWLPIWLIGLGVMGYALYEIWGWPGPAAAVGAAALLLVAMVMYGRHLELREWAAAPAALRAAVAAADMGRQETAWQQLQTAFFIPSAIGCTTEMARHGRSTLELLRRLSGERLSAQDAELLGQLDGELAKGAAGGAVQEEPDFDSDLTDSVRELIQRRGHPATDG